MLAKAAYQSAARQRAMKAEEMAGKWGKFGGKTTENRVPKTANELNDKGS